jgi:outer membrane protein TolC
MLAFLACHAAAQEAAASYPSVRLEEILAEAAASGPDLKLVDQSLGAARLQRSLDLAKQGLALSASGGYALAEALGADGVDSAGKTIQQSLTSKAEAAATGSSALATSLGLAQSAQGALALSTPLTKLSLSASHSLPPVTAGSSSVYPSSTVGLTATQTIWDGYPGGQFTAALEKSRLTLQGKELSAAQGRSAAVAKAKQAYVTMLAAQRDLGIKKQVLDKLSKLLEQLKAVFALQQASAIDLKTAEINARSAQIDETTAEKTLRLANERLALLMGRPAGDRFSVSEPPDPRLPAASIDEAIRVGLDKRVDLAQYGLSAASSRVDASLARAAAQPGLSVSGGAGLALAWTAQPMEEGALSLGAKVTLPLLDSGAAELQAKTAESQAALYDLQSEQLRKSLASDIRDYYETASLLFEKIDLARQSADLAEAQFELVKTQSQYGTATTQDMLAASVTAATAEVGYGSARNAYLLAVLNLETAMGM